MVVIVFRTRLREGINEQELATIGARIYEIASAMPGFISYKDFTAEDGESVTIVEFESLDTLAAWREHPRASSCAAAWPRRIFRRISHSGLYAS